MIKWGKQQPRPAEVLVVWSWARFARQAMDAQYYRIILRRLGGQLFSLTDNIPPDSPYALVIEAIIDQANQDQRERIVLETKRGLQEVARQGYAIGGLPPRGYRAVKVVEGTKPSGQPRYRVQWEPDPEVAPLVTLAFKMRAAGATYKEIHQATHIYKTYKSGLSTMFRNRSYLGIRKCGALEVPQAFEPLVDQESWDKVQARHSSRAQPVDATGCPVRSSASRFLLSGLLTCGLCGATVYRSPPH